MPRQSRISHQTMFWCGVASLVLSLSVINGSHALHVYDKSNGGSQAILVMALDVIGYAGVMFSMVVIHLAGRRR